MSSAKPAADREIQMLTPAASYHQFAEIMAETRANLIRGLLGRPPKPTLAKVFEGNGRTLTTSSGFQVPIVPLGAAAEAVLQLAAEVDRFFADARAAGVDDDRARALLDAEMARAQERPDVTSADALASARRKLLDPGAAS